ncbi:putative lipoprotein [Lysobacter antibioticus]|nr:putative lipoprotein [Lysobacter antibioticus]
MRKRPTCMRLHDGFAIVALTLFALSAVGCGGTPAPSDATASAAADPFVPAPPDVGDVGRYHACKATPRRALSERERCEIAALATHCSPANDCLVSCLSSPGGVNVGGGCWHVCFSGMHRDEPAPPGFAECERSPDPSRLGTPGAAGPSVGQG